MAYNFLLIDDSSIVRKSLKKTIGLAKLDVSEFYEAENGQQGLELLKQNWVDLVFLDINMPVMNGLEFMENVAGDLDLKDTKVIVVSTEGSLERQEKLLELGVKGYLRKPFTPEELIEKVNDLLHGGENE